MNLHCDCGKRLIVNEAHVGRTVRCPTCSKAHVIATSSSAISGNRPLPRAAPQGRSSLPVLLRAVAVLVLVAAVAAGAWWLWSSRSPEADDLTLVPPDAAGVVILDVAALWAKPALRDQAGLLPAMLEEWTGQRPDQVRRLTLVAHDPTERLGWIVVRTMSEIDRSKVLSRLRGAEARTYARRPLYLGTLNNQEAGIAFVRPDVMVLGEPASVKHALGVLSRRRSSTGALASVLIEARTRPVTLALGASSWWDTIAAQAPAPYRSLLGEVRFASLGMEIDNKARLQGRIAMINEVSAAEVKRQLGLALAAVKAPVLPAEARAAVEELSDFLDSTQIEQEGDEAHFTAEGDAAKFVRTIVGLVMSRHPLWGR